MRLFAFSLSFMLLGSSCSSCADRSPTAEFSEDAGSVDTGAADALTAADGGGRDGADGSVDSVIQSDTPIEDAARSIAEAICRHRERCLVEHDWVFNYPDFETCVGMQLEPAWWEWDNVEQDPAAFVGCPEALDAKQCDDPTPIPECDAPGFGEVGAACHSTRQCIDDLFCAVPSFGHSCAKCVVAPGEGEPCLEVESPLGGVFIICGEGTICGADSVCRRLALLGETCTPGTCDYPLTCIEGTCNEPLELGDSCIRGTGDPPCGPGLYCSDDVCSELLLFELGDDCASQGLGECRLPATCFEQRCRMPAGLGGPCLRDGDCVWGLACEDEACVDVACLP